MPDYPFLNDEAVLEHECIDIIRATHPEHGWTMIVDTATLRIYVPLDEAEAEIEAARRGA